MRTDPLLRAPRPVVILLAVAVPPLICLALTGFREVVPPADAALCLVLAIVTAAATGMRSVGWLAALSAAVSFDVFLTVPYGTLSIDDPTDIATTLLVLAVGAAVTEIALWGRRVQAASSRTQGYLDGLLGADLAVAARGLPGTAVVDQVCRSIEQVLEIDRCTFAADGPGGLVLADDGSVTRGGRTVDVARTGLPTDAQLWLAARSGGADHGWFVLTAATRVVRPGTAQLRTAVALAHQAGAALAAGVRGDTIDRHG